MLKRVDRHADLNLHSQVKQQLREMIEDEYWVPGQVIPTEKELEEILGVSRATVRQALVDLVREGYIHRYAGKGTFVAPAKIHDRTQRIGYLVQDLQQHGYKVRSRILDFAEVTDSPAQVRKHLDLLPHHRVIRFRRLMLEEDVPFGLSTVHALLDSDVQIAREDLERSSLSAIMRRLGQQPAVRAERTLEAVLATPMEQNVLKVPPNSPLLLSRSVIITERGERVGLTKAVYRGDRFKYSVTLTL